MTLFVGQTEDERTDWGSTDYSSNEGQSVDEEDVEALEEALTVSFRAGAKCQDFMRNLH